MLQRIALSNFRCFEHYEIDFKQGINLLIGDNGSGKTSILRAVVLSMNSFFKGFSDENTSCSGIGVDDFCHTVSNDTKSMTMPVEIVFDTDKFRQIRIYRKSLKGGTTYPNSKAFNKETIVLRNKVAHEGRNGEDMTALPLFAYFASDDIHGYVQKVRIRSYKDYYVSRSFGYYLALRGGYFLKNWMDRMLVLQEGGKNEEEVDIVRRAVVDCLGENGCNIISDISVRPIQGYVYFHYIDGREARFEDLSDGYKRLVNIVVDLAFRCSILNRSVYGHDCVRKTGGVVCIDELDEHLHPALQSTIVKALQKTFPALQFVISTHAPLVMTSVEDIPQNQVVQLGYAENQYSHESINTYGVDASTIIKQYLHVANRDRLVDKELSELEQLIDDERVSEAKELLEDLRTKYSDRIPELSKAEALLSFYE